MGNILIRVLAVLLCLAARPAAGQVIGTPVLASAPNFRDIAGIAAAYGGTGFVNVTSQFGLMRTGVFYRSDALNGLSDTDWRTISSLGIGRDIDLRTPSEIASAPDLVPGGAFYTNVNIYGSSSPPSFPSFASSLSESLGYFENLYRGFVTDPTERANFRTVLLTLAHDPFPDVYHCSGGKDRTGWTSAILESIAGVPSATIMRDYLATDSYTAATIEASRAAILAEQPGANAATITVLLGVVPGYLEAALDQVNQSYGSMYGYLIQGLGLTLEDIYVLRAKMVSYPVLPGQGGLAGNAASGAALLNGLQQSALSGRYTAYNFYLQSSVDLGGLGGVPGQVGGQVHADTASALLRQPGWVDEALRPYGESRDLAAGQARFWLAGLGGAFWTQGERRRPRAGSKRPVRWWASPTGPANGPAAMRAWAPCGGRSAVPGPRPRPRPFLPPSAAASASSAWTAAPTWRPGPWPASWTSKATAPWAAAWVRPAAGPPAAWPAAWPPSVTSSPGMGSRSRRKWGCGSRAKPWPASRKAAANWPCPSTAATTRWRAWWPTWMQPSTGGGGKPGP